MDYECPGCGLSGLHGPFPGGEEGSYYECHNCDRHIWPSELEDEDGW